MSTLDITHILVGYTAVMMSMVVGYIVPVGRSSVIFTCEVTKVTKLAAEG